MKLLLLAATVFALAIDNFIFSQSVNWAWSKSSGSVSNDFSNATCSDINGNVYVTGTFQGSSITFGSYTLYNYSSGSLDIYLVKHDSNGNVLWAKSGGGTNNDYCYGICSDSSGNVYISGYFRSASIDFGNVTLDNEDSTGSSTDIFIIKYDSSGNIQWGRSVVNPDWELSNAICTDGKDIYVTGQFHGPCIFGNDTLTSLGSYDIFLAKYNSNGNLSWARSVGGLRWDNSLGICTDLNSNVYVTGNFENLAIFGNDTIYGNWYSNTFLAKFDNNGYVIWAKPVAGTNFYRSSALGICSDASNNIYITGWFMYSIVFSNDTLSNYGTASVYTAKYDSSGNAIWGRSPGGTGNDFGNSICRTIGSNVVVTGYFESSYLNFGGIPVLNANVGFDDIFVVEYDANGNSIWATGIGDSDNDFGMGTCSGIDGSTYVTGYFGSYSLNFGSSTVINNGSYDMFLAKVGLLTEISESDYSDSRVFPNPFTDRLSFSCMNNELTEVKIFDISARIVFQRNFTGSITLNTHELTSGIYIYELRSGAKNGIKGKIFKY